ncbi:MAG: DMT family transporter [Opitutales bacterium]
MTGLGTVLVLLAAVCWGLSGGIGGILMADGWDPFVVSFYRGAIGLLFVLGWLAVRPYESGLRSGRLWLWSALAGLGVAGNFAFYFVSIANGSVAVAVTLMYCAPVFVYLVSFALKLEQPTVGKGAAIGLVLVGILLLTQLYDVGAGGVTLIGAGAGLLAGLSYALFIFGFKFALPHGSPQAILTIAFGVLGCVLFLPGDNAQIIEALTTPDWPLFVALGILGAGLSFLAYVFGLRNTVPSRASIIATVEPITAALFGVLILGERLAIPQILGMVLILVTITVLTVRTRVIPVEEVATATEGIPTTDDSPSSSSPR